MIRSAHSRPPGRVDVYLRLKDTANKEGVRLDVIDGNGDVISSLFTINCDGIHLFGGVSDMCQMMTDKHDQVVVRDKDGFTVRCKVLGSLEPSLGCI